MNFVSAKVIKHMMETKIDLFTYSCRECGKCIQKCSNHVLKLINNGMTRFVNVIDEKACNACCKCEKVCTHQAIKIVHTS